MMTRDNVNRFARVKPVGEALVTTIPKEMPPKFAEKSARALLARQPRHRFPDHQQFAITDDHQLEIRGLGHDLDAIRAFDNELQGYWFRSWSRGKYGIVWPETGLDRLRYQRSERLDKYITFALIGVLAVLAVLFAILE